MWCRMGLIYCFSWSNSRRISRLKDMECTSCSVSIVMVVTCLWAECIGQKNWGSDSTWLPLGKNAGRSACWQDAAVWSNLLMHWSHCHNSIESRLPRCVSRATRKSCLLMLIPTPFVLPLNLQFSLKFSHLLKIANSSWGLSAIAELLVLLSVSFWQNTVDT